MTWTIVVIVVLVLLLETVGRRAFEEHIEELRREQERLDKGNVTKGEK
jgi:hypothetical protein